MAKKKSEMADVSRLFRLAVAATRCGVKRQTIISAIEREEIEPKYTGCGVPLVTLEQVRTWRDLPNRRGPGRPPSLA